MKISQDNETKNQITQSIILLKDILGSDLLGVYLYGSSVVGGLQKYSDIDLFVVSNRSTTIEEKRKLVSSLLQISGVYMKSSKRSLEITIVVKSKINPWHYPPSFDFQYGEWLRKKFESGNIEPWPSKEMPDLALLITQILLANKILLGPSPSLLLSDVPYQDFVMATKKSLDNLISDLNSDTRNVLLTYARIWATVETDTIYSKPDAASWVIERLPEEYQPAIKRARAIYIGDEIEHWDDVKIIIQPCANYILSRINKKISLIEFFDNPDKVIKLDKK